MKIYKTKNGRSYIKLKSGRARFIKTKSSKSTTTTKTRYKMARRRYKQNKRRASRSSMFGKLNRPIMGAAGMVAYESFISPMIPVQGTAKDLLELSAGYWLSKKKGFMGAMGNSLMVINSYQILSGFVGDKLKGVFGGSSSNTLFA